MRALPLLAVLALGAATAQLAACGSNDGRIPAGDASSLQSALDEVSSAYRSGRCTTAEQAVTRANAVLSQLPASVNSRLRSRLQSGIANLAKRVPATCTATQTQTQQTETQQTTSTDTSTTETSTTDTGTTDTGTTGTGTTGTGTTGTGTTATGTTGTETGTTTGTTTGDGTGGTSGGTP